MPTIVYYISSHGFGHAVRATEIIRHIDRETRIIIKTAVPEWFFIHELDRPLEFVNESFDIGCRQIDAIRVDWDGTFTDYQEMEKQNDRRLDDEIRFLENESVDLVISDVPAFPLIAARRASIPSLMTANFTWADIYREGIGDRTDLFPMIERLEEAYALNTLLLKTPFSLPMPYFERVEPAPLIARQGVSIRSKLCDCYGLDPEKRFVMIYVGAWGMDMMRWAELERHKDIQFITAMKPPVQVSNLLALPPDAWPHANLTASCDATLAKPGYGICGECVSAGVPLLYSPREEFAEFHPMERDLLKWGGAIRVDEDDFIAFRLERYLEQLPELNIDPDLLPSDGAAQCARRIQHVLENGWEGIQTPEERVLP